MSTDQQKPMEAMANKACRQCTRIMNRCCTNGNLHWWCVDCRIRVDVPKEQKPMSEVENARQKVLDSFDDPQEKIRWFRGELESFEQAVRAEERAKILALLAEKWKKCWGPELHSFELEQLASEIKGKQ